MRIEDRISSAWGIETRLPYLDHEILEAHWNLDNYGFMREGAGKFNLRNALNKLLPLNAFKAKVKLPKPGNTVDSLFAEKSLFDLINDYRADYINPDLYSLYADAFYKYSRGYKKDQIENWDSAVMASLVLSRVLMTELSYVL